MKRERSAKPPAGVSLVDFDNTLRDGFLLFSFAKHLEAEGVFSSVDYGELDELKLRREKGHGGDYQAFAEAVLRTYGRGLAGRSAAAVLAAGRYFAVQVELHPFAEELCQRLAAATRVIIVSGSPREVIAAVADRLGAREVYATTLATDGAGSYTGEVEAEFATSAAKRDLVARLQRASPFPASHSLCLGDSAADLPMACAVDHAFIMRPDGPPGAQDPILEDLAFVTPSSVLDLVGQRLAQLERIPVRAPRPLGRSRGHC